MGGLYALIWKGLLAENFNCVKRCPFPPLSMCHRWKISQLQLKNRKLHFCQILGLSKLLTRQEISSQKALPYGNTTSFTGNEIIFLLISQPVKHLNSCYIFLSFYWVYCILILGFKNFKYSVCNFLNLKFLCKLMVSQNFINIL